MDGVDADPPVLGQEDIALGLHVLAEDAGEILILAQVADVAVDAGGGQIGAELDAVDVKGAVVEPRLRIEGDACDRARLGGDDPVRAAALKAAASRNVTT